MIESNEFGEHFETKSLSKQCDLLEAQLLEAQLAGDKDLIAYYREALEQVNIETSNNENQELKELKNQKGLAFEHIGQKKIAINSIKEDDGIFGNPETDDNNWHMQNAKYSCAVVCQEFVAEQLLNKNFSEKEFADFAEKKGWYNVDSGTSLYDTGNILEELGINVQRNENLTLNDLAQELESDGKIICAVNTSIMQNPLFSLIPGLKADHAVQVIGIDYSNPKDPEVVLNDPGVENGQGRRVNLNTFLKAWETSNNFAAIAKV